MNRSRTLQALCAAAGAAALLSSAPARAQEAADALGADCTISILNRTVRVQPDGRWRVDNVPANFGRVRARATCVRNGATRGGMSGFFVIAEGEVTGFDGAIRVGQADPIPASLSLAPASLRLSRAGETAQLTATALLPDGTSADVTASSRGTSYTISNPAIASITADGLVTAHSSGAVVVSATNEGALGLLRVEVVLSGDTDGDGIPDDVELRLGLDPSNPVDAVDDADRDGLTSADEVARGTDPRAPDTDGDTIGDGEEVVGGADGFVTNPLLPDTDGDGVRDALEVATGTDPTDARSVNLRGALSAIEATPAVFELAYNTVLGEAFRQLQVTGLLRDGSTLDLTSARLGTRYASSDIAVASFGAEDGRIYAGQNGDAQITITSNGFTTLARVAVRAFSPVPISLLPIPGYANNVEVNGDHAFIAAGAAGLQVIDVGNRAAPRIIASLDTPGNANDIRLDGALALIADGSAGLRLVDVAEPPNPRLVGALDTDGDAVDVAARGDRAYLAASSSGLQVIDVSNPESPRLAVAFATRGAALGVDVDAAGTLAAVALGTGGVELISLEDESRPASRGIVATGNARDVVIDGPLAVVAEYSRSLSAIHLANPLNPTLHPTPPLNPALGGLLQDVAMARGLAFGADVFFVNGVPIAAVDPPVPEDPVTRVNWRATLDFTIGLNGARDDNGIGIAVDGTYVYLTAGPPADNGVTGDTRLYIGQYLAALDVAGVAPVVAISSPGPGDSFREGTLLRITADARDDFAVAWVDFLIDGVVRFRDTSPPYAYSHRLPRGGAPRLTLGARAVDQADNAGVSAPVEVLVVAEPLTTVIGRVVDLAGLPLAGATVACQGGSAVTDDEGRFAIPGLPALPGGLGCVFELISPDGTPLTASIRGVEAVPGGITDLGDVVVRPPPAELYPGALFPVGYLPRQILSGDLDQDGIQDLVVRLQDFEVAVLLGLGDARLGPASRFDAGESPTAIALADFDGDGVLDVAAGRAGAFDSSQVAVLFGSGNGELSERQDLAVLILEPGDIVAADLDQDGDPDLAAVSEGAAQVVFNTGDGAFDQLDRLDVGPEPLSIAAGDFNGDAIRDLAVANGSASTFSVLLGEGAGSFAGLRTVALESDSVVATELAVADIDGDGIEDLAAAVSEVFSRFEGNFPLQVMPGSSSGVLQVAPQGTWDFGAQSLAAGDVTGDGRIDLVAWATPTSHDASNNGLPPGIAVFVGQASGSFDRVAPQPITSSYVVRVALADLDPDGRPELLTTHVTDTGRDSVVVHRFDDGAAIPASATPALLDGGGLAVAVGDLNRDGLADAVTGNQSTLRSISVLLAQPGGALGEAQVLPTLGSGTTDLVIADFDADGLADVASANGTGATAAQDVSVFRGKGDGTFHDARVFAVGQRPRAILAVDLDGDARPDLVTANSGDNDVSVLLKTADGFAPQERFAAGDGPVALATGDLNLDALADVVVGTLDPVGPVVLQGVGGGDLAFYQQISLLAEPSEQLGVGVVDFDGDGAMEVVAAGSGGADRLHVLFESGTFWRQQTLSTGVEVLSPKLSIADFDGDDNADIGMTSSFPGSFSVLRGKGDGSFAGAEHFAAWFPLDLAVGDLNGDGELDVVAAGGTTGGITVLLHR